MSNLRKILIGIVVGISSILPGISGGMIATAYNIYTELIEALSNLTKNPFRAIKSIWQYLVGITLGIIISVILVQRLMYHIPIPATLLFLGLILGSLPNIWRLAKQKKVDLFGCLLMLFMFVLMIAILFIPFISDIENTAWYIWMIIGSLVAVSFIIPGLSGTMILMVIGFYTALISIANNVLRAVIEFNFEELFNLSSSVLWLFLGFVITVVLVAKMMNRLIKKAPHRFYQAIVGVVLSAPFTIIYSLNLELIDQVDIFNLSEQWVMWLIGIIVLPLGIYLSIKFSGKKHETKENQTSN